MKPEGGLPAGADNPLDKTSKPILAPMLQAALKYGASGWDIFPCGPDKAPLTAHGLKDAAHTSSQITAWWKKWPDAMIGCNCERSGLAVIDLDVKNNINGLESWTALGIDCMECAWITETPSGGSHLIFTGDIPSTTGKLGPGIDTRGRGGYIILPPSRSEAGEYKQFGGWSTRTPEPGPIHPQLVELLKARKPSNTTQDEPPKLPRLVKEGAVEGQRNASIFKLASRYRSLNLDLTEARCLIQEAASQCTPPLPPDEAETCLQSAWAQPPGMSGTPTPDGPAPMPEPQIERLPSGHRFHFGEDVTLTVSRIHSHSDGRTSAELTFLLAGKIIHVCSLNLLSSGTVRSLSKTLQEKDAGHNWSSMLDQIIPIILEKEREGEPVVTFSAAEPITAPVDLVYPLLPEGAPTTIFADPGCGKSYLAAVLGLAVAGGWSNNPLSMPVTHQANTLYLDWEASESAARWRFHRINKGTGLPLDHRMKYRHCCLPLADDIGPLAEIVHREKIGLLIVDSLAPASGLDMLEAQVAVRFYTALRQLGTTTLVIAHCAKSAEGNRRTIFGSTFFTALSRSVWEMRRLQDEGSDTIKLGLFHRKCNDGRLERPIGLELAFSGDSVAIRRTNEPKVTEFTQSTQGPSLADQIMAYLAEDGPATVAGIAASLGATTDTVRTTLHRLVKAEKVIQSNDAPSRWSIVQ